MSINIIKKNLFHLLVAILFRKVGSRERGEVEKALRFFLKFPMPVANRLLSWKKVDSCPADVGMIQECVSEQKSELDLIDIDSCSESRVMVEVIKVFLEFASVDADRMDRFEEQVIWNMPSLARLFPAARSLRQSSPGAVKKYRALIEFIQLVDQPGKADRQWLYSANEFNDNSAPELMLGNTKLFHDLMTLEWTDSNHVEKHFSMILSRLADVVLVARRGSEIPTDVFRATAAITNLLEAGNTPQQYYPKPSYSQEGEDSVLDRIMNQQENGFYVDVGAHHPVRFSNTYRFYQKGWCGINIDPLPASSELFDVMRPRDINLEVAISTRAETQSMATYLMFNEPAYNSLSFDKIADIAQIEGVTLEQKIDVPIRTLNSVLEEHAQQVDKIDFINIDVELAEIEVLESINLERWHPEFIVIEMKEFSLQRSEGNEVYNYLIQRGYYLRSFLSNTGIFQSI